MASNGKVALVTGAGGGIGKAATLALLADCWKVVLAGRPKEPLDAATAESGANKRSALAISADVTDAITSHEQSRLHSALVALGAKGTFVNTASIYGTTASVGRFNYNAAKAAVIMVTRSAALELAPHGIRVVAVAPGFINTPILGNDAAMKEALAKQHLHGKLIEPEQAASVVTFLFTDGASAINGSTIPVEDGFQVFKNS